MLASKFYDSYLQLNNSDAATDCNYFNLIGAIAYYLCDQIGSSLVLIKNINVETLDLSKNKLDILIYHLLNNSHSIEISQSLNPDNNEHISEFVRQYNELMTQGISIDRNFINAFRKSVYNTNDYRDIFLVDALLAIFILKINHSIFEMLPLKDTKYCVDMIITLNNYLYTIAEIAEVVLEYFKMLFFKNQEGFFPKNDSDLVDSLITKQVDNILLKYYGCPITKLNIYETGEYISFWLPATYSVLDEMCETEFNDFDKSCFDPPEFLKDALSEIPINAQIFMYQHDPKKIISYQNIKQMFIKLILPQQYAFRPSYEKASCFGFKGRTDVTPILIACRICTACFCWEPMKVGEAGCDTQSKKGRRI